MESTIQELWHFDVVFEGTEYLTYVLESEEEGFPFIQRARYS